MTPCCPTSVHEASKAAGCYAPEWLAHKFLAIQPGVDGPDLELRNCRDCGGTLAIELPPPPQTTAWLAGESAGRNEGQGPSRLIGMFRLSVPEQFALLGITNVADYARAIGEYSSGYHRGSRRARLAGEP